jgi:hypothetical protein
LMICSFFLALSQTKITQTSINTMVYTFSAGPN